MLLTPYSPNVVGRAEIRPTLGTGLNANATPPRSASAQQVHSGSPVAEYIAAARRRRTRTRILTHRRWADGASSRGNFRAPRGIIGSYG